MVQDRAMERGVCLTETEAMGLLDMLMTYPGELDTAQRAGLIKLSDYCRLLIRDGRESKLPQESVSAPSRSTTIAA